MTNDDLIREIERFASEFGIAPASVTSRSVSNSRLYSRLKNGQSCTLLVASKVQTYMTEKRRERSRDGKGEPPNHVWSISKFVTKKCRFQ